MPPQHPPDDRRLAEIVAARIRQARESMGWTQDQLAERIGRTQVAVSRYEIGKHLPDLTILAQIAHSTGRPMSWFLGEESQQATETELRDLLDYTTQRIQSLLGGRLPKLTAELEAAVQQAARMDPETQKRLAQVIELFLSKNS